MTYEELHQQIVKKGTCLCVGLDTDIEKIPLHLRKEKYPMFAFNRAIIDATAPYCVAYKPNTAFYEAEGSEGWHQLEMTAAYIREHYPKMFLIADAKRGDIGNTAARYAKAFFEAMNFDAVTISPYMGRDAVDPFLKYPGKWVIVLALTSNASAENYETSTIIKKNLTSLEFGLGKGQTVLYEKIIQDMMHTDPDSKNKIMFVVGATWPQQLLQIRRFCPDHFLLVPGVGAQGGSFEEVIKYGANKACGLLVNSSRGIIYASSGEDFATAAAKAASAYKI